MTARPNLIVACAIIEKQGVILAARRSRALSQGGYWEFPGGKVASGESPEVAVVREIKEELGAIVKVKRGLAAVTFEYPDKTVTLIPFVCDGTGAAFAAREHESLRWVDEKSSRTLSWLPPDVEILEAYWKEAKVDSRQFSVDG
jgi:8-oxo-dGTP diphosphatase